MSCRPCRVEASFRSAISPPPCGPSSTRTYMRAACIRFCIRSRRPASMNASSDLATSLISYPTNAASCSLVNSARGCLCKNSSRSRSQAWRTTRAWARRAVISLDPSSDGLEDEIGPPPPEGENSGGVHKGRVLAIPTLAHVPVRSQATFCQQLPRAADQLILAERLYHKSAADLCPEMHTGGSELHPGMQVRCSRRTRVTSPL